MSHQLFRPDRFLCEPELGSCASRLQGLPAELTNPATAPGIADNTTILGRYYLSKTVAAFTGKPGLKAQSVGEGVENAAADFQVSWIYGCPHRCVFCHQIYLCRNYPYIAIYPRIKEVEREIREIASTWQGDRPFVCEVDTTTDILALEHLTGWLSRLILFFANEVAPHGQMRFITKSANAAPLLGLAHRRATRVGVSLTLAQQIREMEPGTAGLPARLNFLTKVIGEGYPVHVSIAPVVPTGNYERAYEKLFERLSAALLHTGQLELADVTLDVLVHYVKPECEGVVTELAPHAVDGMVTRRVDGRARLAYPEETCNRAIRFFRRMVPQYLPTARIISIQ